MHETRRLDAPAVLVDDGADVVELARGRRRALQPVGSVLRERSRDDEQRDSDSAGATPTATAGHGPAAGASGRYRRASGSVAATARRYGPTPWIAVVGEYS